MGADRAKRFPAFAFLLMTVFVSVMVLDDWILTASWTMTHTQLYYSQIPVVGGTLASSLAFTTGRVLPFLVFYYLAGGVVLEGSTRRTVGGLLAGAAAGWALGLALSYLYVDVMQGITFLDPLSSLTPYGLVTSAIPAFFAGFSGLALRHFVKLESLLGIQRSA